MKHILIIALFCLLAKILYAQDLIVTDDGDSINCKITKVKADHIYFTFKHKEDVRSTLISVENVSYHQFDYYPTSEVPRDKTVSRGDYQQFRLALNAGYSYQIAKVAESVPNDFKSYIKGLKSGYHFGGDLTYYFTEPLGVGFKYYLFKSSNKIDNIYIGSIDNRRYGMMSDDLTISFIGPTFSSRLLNDEKRNAFLIGLSLGYMGYSNDKIIIDKYKMTGSTMGLSLDIGYDIGLSENFALGFQISLLTGTLSKYDWSDGVNTETIKLEKGSYESLNRFDFSVGLRFMK